MIRRALLALTLLLLTFSVSLIATGGFTTSVLGVRLSAHSALPSAVAAAVILAVWAALAARANALTCDLVDLHVWLAHQARTIVLTIAALATAVAVRCGTYSAAGSDASGYLSEAALFWELRLSRVEPLAAIADWPGGAEMLPPLGWRMTLDPSVQVPTYPVGLPLLMAAPHGLGGSIAACLVVALSLGLAVWATAKLASRVAGPLAAVLAAVWMAMSPIALVQAVQPMTDVPVTAAWMVCWLIVGGAIGSRTSSGPAELVLSRALYAGLAAAVAILIRPNLAPLGIVPALYLAKSAPGPFLRSGVLAFATPVAVAGAIVAWLQWYWFGSPLRSGYGTAAELFDFHNIPENVALYTRWLLETHGPWLLIAPIAGLFLRRSRTLEPWNLGTSEPWNPGTLEPWNLVLRWMLAFAALVCVSYFIYDPFDNWTYLRFLLPAIAVAIVAASAIVAAAVQRAPVAARAPIVVAIALALAAQQASASREHGVFQVAAQHARVVLAGRYLEAVLPARAVLVAGEQSGSMRYYTDRSILRWDLLAPDALAPALSRLAAAGHEPWIVLDAFEDDKFRAKFRTLPDAELDWPPALDAGTQLRTRAWRLADRSMFMAGARIKTERLR